MPVTEWAPVIGIALAAPIAYSIPWWTVDGGGGTSQGGEYTVSGTIGQADTSPLMSSGDYEVVGGFRAGRSQPTRVDMQQIGLIMALIQS